MATKTTSTSETDARTIRVNIIDESGYGVQTRVYKVPRTMYGKYVWRMAKFAKNAKETLSWLTAKNIPFVNEKNSQDTRIVNISETDVADREGDVDECESNDSDGDDSTIASWGDDDEDSPPSPYILSGESEPNDDNADDDTVSSAATHDASIPANVLREKNSD